MANRHETIRRNVEAEPQRSQSSWRRRLMLAGGAVAALYGWFNNDAVSSSESGAADNETSASMEQREALSPQELLDKRNKAVAAAAILGRMAVEEMQSRQANEQARQEREEDQLKFLNTDLTQVDIVNPLQESVEARLGTGISTLEGRFSGMYNISDDDALAIYREMTENIRIEQDLRSVTVSVDGEYGFDTVFVLSIVHTDKIVQEFGPEGERMYGAGLFTGNEEVGKAIAHGVDMTILDVLDHEFEKRFGYNDEYAESLKARGFSWEDQIE